VIASTKISLLPLAYLEGYSTYARPRRGGPKERFPSRLREHQAPDGSAVAGVVAVSLGVPLGSRCCVHSGRNGSVPGDCKGPPEFPTCTCSVRLRWAWGGGTDTSAHNRPARAAMDHRPAAGWAVQRHRSRVGSMPCRSDSSRRLGRHRRRHVPVGWGGRRTTAAPNGRQGSPSPR